MGNIERKVAETQCSVQPTCKPVYVQQYFQRDMLRDNYNSACTKMLHEELSPITLLLYLMVKLLYVACHTLIEYTT